MENASKAIIMAGSILIAVILISLLVIVFSQIGDMYKAEDEVLTEKQLTEYNRQFNTYDRSLYGSELLSLANLIEDYNNRLLGSENETGTFYEDNKFDVKVVIAEGTIGYEGEEISYNGLKATGSGGKDISVIKDYNDKLESLLSNLEKNNVDKKSDDYVNVKASLTELRSMPFKCTSKKYNKYGRISEMTFEQQWDTDIENTINYRIRGN